MTEYDPGLLPDPGPLGSEDLGDTGGLEDRAPLSPPEAPPPPPPASSAAVSGGPHPETSAPAAGASAKRIAPKEYYSISEVCDLVGLKPHVLRYWESQFPVLNPSKNRSGNRVYQRKEIKLILLVQHLLYKEKYTIEGARQRLDQLRRGGKGGELGQATSHAVDAEMRKLLHDELTQLLEVLSPHATGGAGAGEVSPGAARPGRSAE